MNRNVIAVSLLAGALLMCGHARIAAAKPLKDGAYITLGLGYEPQDYFSRISRQGNPVSVMRAGLCASALCLEYEHHSSVPLGGPGAERETNTIALLFHYGFERLSLEGGPAIDYNRNTGGYSAFIGRIQYHLASHFSLDYEHIAGKHAHINLYGIVATWWPFAHGS